MTNPRIEKYWNDFLATQPPDSPYRSKSYVAEGFGDHPKLADELGALILNGIKTGTCSALWEWEVEGNPIPEGGLISITLNGAGEPICILETTEVTLRRYNEVDEDFARSEGEGDRSLAYWRDAHELFFSRVLARIGREFSEDMPLVCERFQVIYQ
ncbi:MAG: ASCH domain-containing protein [Anaerolineales bacterium]|nr:MAG: ASCH domain-containing protein [Anaerolineales bacterium]